MMRYVARRMLHEAVLLLLVSVLSFVFLKLAPGNYVDGMRLDPRISAQTASMWRAAYALDRPLPVQYIRWLGSAAQGKFGYSFAYGMPVGRLLWPRVKNTLLLTGLATAFSWFAALAIGVAAAATERRAIPN